MQFYRTVADEVIKAQGREGEFAWHVPGNTVFEMPADWRPDDNSVLVTAEWLREYRADGRRLKNAIRVELRLLKTDAWAGDLGDLQDIEKAVIILHRMQSIGDEEFGEFLEELERAERRLREGYRRRA